MENVFQAGLITSLRDVVIINTMENETVRRPGLLTLLAILLFMAGAAGFYRFGWCLAQWQYVWSITAPFQFWFLLNSGLAGGVFFWVVAVLVWRRVPAGRVVFLPGVVLFSIFYWVGKFLISLNPVAWTNWPFELVLNLLLVSTSLGILFSPQADQFFQKEEK
jgi:hypothetical protein